MNFADAMIAVKAGNLVTNGNWNGKDMFIFLVPGSEFTVNRAPLLGIFPEGTAIKYNAHIDMRHADGTIGPWTPSQKDMESTDWWIVDKMETQSTE